MIDWTELDDGFSPANELEIIEYIQQQRWFGGKGRGVVGVDLLDHVVLREDTRLLIALVEVRFGTGTSDVYQLVLETHVSTDEIVDGHHLITVIDNTTLCEPSNDSEVAHLVATAHGEGISISGNSGEVNFRSVRNIAGAGRRSRPIQTEQSNTSVVLNERLLVKLYRRLEAGINPELELLLFLTEHGFANIPELAGWYSYAGPNLRTTLGLAQQFVPDAIDGWNLGLDELSRSPEQFLGRIDRLGEVIGEMHRVLASDSEDPDFAPEEPTEEAAAILGAKLEQQVDLLAEQIPHGRSNELRTLAQMLTQDPIPGTLIRSHGDLHLGQLLWTKDDWLIIDFEGEPARSVAERRQKVHPLRDIAGLLRSFDYLGAALELEREIVTPPSWELEARERFLVSYRAVVASARVLPHDHGVQERLLRVYELEKILYELDYEIQHRPSWISVPLSGIDRLLDVETD